MCLHVFFLDVAVAVYLHLEVRMAFETFETLRFTAEGTVARMTLNRPQALNAINPLMLEEMAQLWH